MSTTIYNLMKSNPDLEKDILSTLFKHGCIGKHHTPIKKGIKSLRKKKYINLYKTYHGLDVRLVPSSLQEVKKIIDYKEK